MVDESKTRRFERVVMPHMDAAYNLARWLIRHPADTEDVMQEAMLRAYKFLDSCREDTARQWVIRITRNACYDWLGRRAGLPLAFADLDPLDGDGAAFSTDLFGCSAPSPEDLLAQADQTFLFEELVAALPPLYREIIVLRELEEFSYKEIAEIAHLPVGTVMSRLSRARSLLEQEWRRRHG